MKGPSSHGSIKNAQYPGVVVFGIDKKRWVLEFLDGVNEMCPDEKKIHVTLSNGPFIDVNANCPQKLVSAYRQTSI